MPNHPPLDIDAALNNPASVFASPVDILRRTDLSKPQKVSLLERWERDERELMVAADESINMHGEQGESGRTLAKIRSALRALGEDEKPDGVPTRHG